VIQNLILIDDVITTGAQFRAYKNLVLAHHGDVEVIGLFWGKTFWIN
jgi:predicted amidophosphoribosyltransferase